MGVILFVVWAQAPITRVQLPNAVFRGKEVMPESRNQEHVTSFSEYCRANPEQRFWQALRNWSGAQFIGASMSADSSAAVYVDTFHMENGPMDENNRRRFGSVNPNPANGTHPSLESSPEATKKEKELLEDLNARAEEIERLRVECRRAGAEELRLGYELFQDRKFAAEEIERLRGERERMAAFHTDMGIELEQAIRDRETYKTALLSLKQSQSGSTGKTWVDGTLGTAFLKSLNPANETNGSSSGTRDATQ